MGYTTNSGRHDPDAGDDELRARIADLQNELNGLRRALHTRATIEQAMGVLIVSHRCTPQQAFRILVRLSQQHNIKLYRVAQVLVRLAARVEPDRLEPLLRRAAQTGGPGLEPVDSAAEPAEPDSALIALARRLVDADKDGMDGDAREALTDLYELLVERGWVPPYETLATLRVRP
ncbi:ANTAR domain-containing protein [Amycolatopsis arida]|uniref:ANTAR domain-containing protein n=1 Tax=Amycolatopsis arida TaxID=587909 RepID=A0A1I5L5B5_9PSEU|nr:ANTAR domain-containing protein [Amycolatopsis arida]TDX93576.1 ANTAR domain-containing protein [Amycolatopsis arida]SFO92056.1 ANTAR domain-containing protein [Amycolatopsis arida]